MFKNKYFLVSILVILLSIPLPTFGKILFEETFEKDTIGKEPVNLEVMDCPVNRANATIEVVDDPDGKSGKSAKMFMFALYVPKVNGRDDWTDWYWEWDWRWDSAGNPGNAYRIKDGSNFYHFTPRSDGNTIMFYNYSNGNWGQLAQATFPIKLNTWYRYQQTMQGDLHTVKIKERDDNTSFDNIKPAIEAKDGTYKKGTVGGLGTDAGSTWVDNIIIYESPKDMLSVDFSGKLSATWGSLKSR